MARSKGTEFSRIELIERVLSEDRVPMRGVKLGIGDDAAVVQASGRLVWTIDTQIEGVHFDRRWADLESLGYRSFQAALSDLAAMGARPLGALSNLALPTAFSDADLARLVRGQAEAARECRCPLIGGNLAKGQELSITTTGLGRGKKPILRSGALPGDELWLVGELGMAALGLRALATRVPKTASIRRCVERWQRPRALLAEGRRLVGRARAAIDVSDGLGGDAAHLAASSGVRIVVVEALLRAALHPDLVSAAKKLQLEPLAVALAGGEDYALLAAGPGARRGSGVRVIGHLERGRGVVLECASGKRRRLGPSYDHFASSARTRAER